MIFGRIPATPFIHSVWFLSLCMFIFGGTHGWIVVLSCKYIGEAVEDGDGKAMAAVLITITTFLVLGTAQFAGLLLLIGVDTK